MEHDFTMGICERCDEHIAQVGEDSECYGAPREVEADSAGHSAGMASPASREFPGDSSSLLDACHRWNSRMILWLACAIVASHFANGLTEGGRISAATSWDQLAFPLAGLIIGERATERHRRKEASARGLKLSSLES